MKYKVHSLQVKTETMDVALESYLNSIKGEVISIIPKIKPTFMGMGATAKVDSLLIVSRLERG